jgi:rRNA maturation endonuclease Nob1
MGGLLGAVRSLVGNRDGPAKSASSKAGMDAGSEARLQYITDRWTDLKNAYIVYHQACWQSLLFYANQTWIDWDDARKIWTPLTPSDDWVPRPRINRFSPTIDAIASNIYQIPEVESVAVPLDDPDSNMISEIANKLAAWFVDKEGLKRQKETQEDKSGHAAQLFALCGSVFTILRVTSKTVGQNPRMSQQQSMAYVCEVCDKYSMVPVGQEPPKFCPECGNPVDAEPVDTMAQEQDAQSGQPAMDDVSEIRRTVVHWQPAVGLPPRWFQIA